LKSTNDFKNGVISLIAKEEIEKELVEDYIWEYCERIIVIANLLNSLNLVFGIFVYIIILAVM